MATDSRHGSTWEANALLAIVASQPLWWFLGAEQFVYPYLLAVPTVSVVLRRRAVMLSPTLYALWAFILIFLASGLFIVESDRYLTFAKNLSTYIAAALLLVLVPAVIKTWADMRRLLVALLAAVSVSGVLGLLAVADIARPEVTTVVGGLLPDAAASTALGENIAHRSLGWTSWFSGLGSYFRLRGTYLWPTSYAPVLVLSIPIALFLATSIRRRWGRLLSWLVAGMLAVNLVFTTGRVAILALVAAFGYRFFFGATRPSVWGRALAAAALVLLAAVAVVVEPKVIDVGDQLREFTLARGSGSPEARLTIYQNTLRGFLERPILGWGTERNIPGVSDSFIYPAGSHSYYLGVLYRHGLVGLVAFAILWMSLWRDTTTPSSARVIARSDRTEAIRFLSVGRSLVVAALLMSVTLAFDLDAGLMFVWWVLVAAFIATRRLLHAPPESSQGPA